MPPNREYGKLDRLFVFGYGSLIWRPLFDYNRRIVGYVKGYKRRFYQGNVYHRGTTEKPGRVATLLPSSHPEDRVWGCLYEVVGTDCIKDVLEYLHDREVVNGGYQLVQIPFWAGSDEVTENTLMAMTYVHLEEQNNSEDSNDSIDSLYLGKAPLEVQAKQIAQAHGVCGPNKDYVFRLASFMREETHNAEDDVYLDRLEDLVRKYSQEPPIDQTRSSVIKSLVVPSPEDGQTRTIH